MVSASATKGAGDAALRSAGEDTELIKKATDIRLQAERRAGDILREMRDRRESEGTRSRASRAAACYSPGPRRHHAIFPMAEFSPTPRCQPACLLSPRSCASASRAAAIASKDLLQTFPLVFDLDALPRFPERAIKPMRSAESAHRIRRFLVHHDIVDHIGRIRRFVAKKLEHIAVLARQAARVAGSQPSAALAALRFDDFDVAHVFCRTIFVMISTAPIPVAISARIHHPCGFTKRGLRGHHGEQDRGQRSSRSSSSFAGKQFDLHSALCHRTAPYQRARCRNAIPKIGDGQAAVGERLGDESAAA